MKTSNVNQGRAHPEAIIRGWVSNKRAGPRRDKIETLPTDETDPTLVYAPDGSGGVVARAEAVSTLSDDTPLVDAATGNSGTGTEASREDHVHPVPKLDDLATPDDNTDLNASTSAHGLLPKLPGGTSTFLRADGSFAAPSGSGGGYMSRRILSSIANTNTAFNVNSSSYTATAAMSFYHDWDAFPATSFLISSYGFANESTRTVTLQLAALSAAGTPYSSGGDDLVITNNGGAVQALSSGWKAVATSHTGIILMTLAVKGSTATVDFNGFWIDIAFKF